MANNQPFTILTKSGKRSIPDMEKYCDYSKATYAATLTSFEPATYTMWEPNAPTPDERLHALKTAHKKGIKTWVSIEPLLVPKEALDVIEKTKEYADAFKVGSLNHIPHDLNLARYRQDAISALEKTGKPYLIKHDLRAAVDTHREHTPPKVPQKQERNTTSVLHPKTIQPTLFAF